MGELFHALFALLIVVALMGGLTLAIRKLGLAGAEPLAQAGKRLRILETLPLDARRKLALIARDEVEHLVILSADGETVIETGIRGDKTA